MFVKYKTPKWYLVQMDQILKNLTTGKNDFEKDLKQLYCLADDIQYININLKQAVDHRNKIKKQYTERLEKLSEKKNYSCDYNMFEFFATIDSTVFSELFEAKKLLNGLKSYILSARNIIKSDLAGMHDIWKKWYRKAHYLEKKAIKANQKKTGTCRLSLTRSESLAMIKALTDALKKEPNKDSFIMTFNTDIH